MLNKIFSTICPSWHKRRINFWQGFLLNLLRHQAPNGLRKRRFAENQPPKRGQDFERVKPLKWSGAKRPLDVLLGSFYDRGEAATLTARSRPPPPDLNLCSQTTPIFHNDCELPAWRVAQLKTLARQEPGMRM
jgi:hypothetical protein